jgi:membrane associated rhomboid family serine protease
MGIYDRGYMQDDDGGSFRFTGGTRSLVTNIIIVTAAISLADIFTTGKLCHFLALPADLLSEPWKFWTILTYGFAHTSLAQSGGIWHVAMNMFILWMFGRTVEGRLGRSEFLYFYLTAIVVSGLVWLVGTNIWLTTLPVEARAIAPSVVGASGAVTAVFLLFVLYYPHQTLYLYGVLAIPAWVLGVIMVGGDLLRAATGTAGNVAWQAHIGGAAFAYLYARFHWQFTRFLPALRSWPRKWNKPRLKVHTEEDDGSDLDAEGDRILEKLLREGEQNLTRRERRALEKYSRRMREKRDR